MEKSCFVSIVFVLLAVLIGRREGFKADLDTVLRGLLREERFRSVNSENRVAVGFGSCEDIYVDGLDFLRELGIGPPETPRHHDVISSSEQLAEGFTYFFEYGAAAERYVTNAELFQTWVSAARRVNGSRPAIGGNASVMARRFAMEGWQVLLGAKMTEATARKLHYAINIAGNVSKATRDDVHLILEYYLGSPWGRYISPRANRYIIHSDYSNMLLESLDSFIEALDTFAPSLVVVSGLQMLDNSPLDLELRTKKLKRLGQALAKLPVTTKIHFEMASFTEDLLLRDLMKYVIPYTDSIGMNEQELANLYSLMLYGNITLVTHSNPRIATTLDQMRVVYGHLKVKGNRHERALNRMHVHTLASQAILVSKNSDWRNLHGAAAKASLTATRHVCASSWIDTARARIIMDESFSVSTEPGSHRMPLIESAPVSCWSEDSAKICVAPNLVCTTVHQTAGGGDNISAAGLVLQL